MTFLMALLTATSLYTSRHSGLPVHARTQTGGGLNPVASQHDEP